MIFLLATSDRGGLPLLYRDFELCVVLCIFANEPPQKGEEFYK